MARGKRAIEAAAELVEGPWELPEGWRWERLGQLGTWYGGGTPSKENATFWTGGLIPWVSPKDMKTPFIDDSADHISQAAVDGSSTKLVPDGSVLVVTRSGILRHSLPVAVTRREVTLNQDMRAIHPRREVLPGYLANFLRGSAQNILHGCVKDGTTVNSIETDRFMSWPVAIAPIDVQKRILARINELFADIEDGETALVDARAGVETYRKALLKAAVTGELTADWRRDNPSKETGQDLLRRILADRRARWEADPKNRKKRYEEPEGPDQSALPKLPSEWCWASLGQLLFEIQAGLNVKALGRPPAGGETGIVKISAVTWDEFDEVESKALLPSTTIDTADLIGVGDFLLSRANTLELVGAPVIVRAIGLRLLLSDKVLRLVLADQAKEWVYYVLKSPLGRAEIEARSSGAQLSMRNISQGGLRALPIPIPPAAELVALGDFLKSAWAANDDLRQSLAGDTAPADLRQSILSAAFRGELVS